MNIWELAVGCNPDESLRFFLFDHFVIQINLAEGFNSHTIEYSIELRDGSDNVLIAKATIDDDGLIDNAVSNRDREKVLEHYLELIRPVYDRPGCSPRRDAASLLIR